MTKNFDKTVKSPVVKSVSGTDTAQNDELSLKYQQALIDITEIYARRNKKKIKKNRR